MSLKVVDPIEVTEAVLTASDIPQVDNSVGEEAWLSLEDRRDINTISFPPGASRTEFGMYYDDGIHDNAVWFSVMDYGFDDWNIVGMDASFSVVFSTAIPKPTASPNLELCGFFLRASGAFFFWWDSYSKDVSIASASISGSGNPSFNPMYIALTGLSSDHSSNNGKRIFSGGTNQSYFIVMSRSYTGATPYDRVTSERLCILDVAGNEIARKTFPNTQFGTIMDIAMIGDLIYVTRTSGLSDDPYVGEIYNLSLELVASSPLNDVISSVRFIGTSPNGTVNITDNQSNPSFEVLKASDFSPVKSYYAGDQVVYLPNSTVYQCVKDNSNGNPSETATNDANEEWVDAGSPNRWRMFNGILQAKTFSASDFTVTLNPITYVNTLAVLDISGVASIRVEVDNSIGTTIYDSTFSASDFTAIYDHYTYVFYQISIKKKLLVEDLPPLPNTTIRVTFIGSNISVGELVHGFAINVGELVAEDTKSDRFRYREQEFNSFGYPTGQPPITVELNTYDVLVPKLNNPAIQSLLDKVTGENTLWIGDIGGGQKLTTYGFFERSPIPYDMPNDINYQITVRASV